MTAGKRDMLVVIGEVIWDPGDVVDTSDGGVDNFGRTPRRVSMSLRREAARAAAFMSGVAVLPSTTCEMGLPVELIKALTGDATSGFSRKSVGISEARACANGRDPGKCRSNIAFKMP